MAEWRTCCAQAGTVVTDAAPWPYFRKYLLHIAPQERTVYAAELAQLYLPDLTIVLLSSGREVGRCGTALSGMDVEALAPIALTQMCELVFLP